MHRLDVGFAVDVFLAQQAVGNSHEPNSSSARSTTAAKGRSAAAICITARRVESGSHVIYYDANTLREVLKLAHRRRLHDIESSKKYKAQQQRFPRDRNSNQGDELAGDFVDDDELRILRGRWRGILEWPRECQRITAASQQEQRHGLPTRARSSGSASHQRRTVAAEPQLPGPGCRRPVPKKVATSVAQSGARGAGTSGMEVIRVGVFLCPTQSSSESVR